MNVVVHRITLQEATYACDTFRSLLSKDNFKYNMPHEDVIEIGGVRINFRCGDVIRCAGMIINLFNTDSTKAAEFLQQSANKRGGREVDTLEDLYLIVREHITYAHKPTRTIEGLDDFQIAEVISFVKSHLPNICNEYGCLHLRLNTIRALFGMPGINVKANPGLSKYITELNDSLKDLNESLGNLNDALDKYKEE